MARGGLGNSGRPVGLVDASPDIVKAATSVPLEFRREATVGDSGKDADWDALESIYN